MSISNRNFGLDLLRSLAIGGVFLGHTVTLLAPLTIGVDLFFVLSGFLIGRIYFRESNSGSFSLNQFWAARWWRTLPPYLAALSVVALAQTLIQSNPLDWHYLFFLQNMTAMKGFGPSWSLCVEEHFYLVFPVVALIAERTLGRKHFIWLIPASFAVPSMLRCLTILWVGGLAHMHDEWYRMSPFHCDGLIAGVFLAYLNVDHPGWFQKTRKLALACSPLAAISMVITPFLGGHLAFEVLNVALIAIGFAGCLRLAIDIQWNPTSWIGLKSRQLVSWVAITSYSVYLLHTLVLSDLHIVLVAWPHGVARTLFMVTLTLSLCIVFYLLVERPSIWMRGRFLAHNSQTIPVQIVREVRVDTARAA